MSSYTRSGLFMKVPFPHIRDDGWWFLGICNDPGDRPPTMKGCVDVYARALVLIAGLPGTGKAACPSSFVKPSVL